MKLSITDVAARNVRLARVARNMSLRALTEKAGVAPNSIRYMEEPGLRAPAARGSTSPRLELLERIAEAVGYEPWHLLIEDFDPHNPPPTRAPTAEQLKTFEVFVSRITEQIAKK